MRHLILVILSIIYFNAYSQQYQCKFGEAFQSGDTLMQKEILYEWEKENPKDAELYTCYFNYYFTKSRREVIELTTEEIQGESFALIDSSGKTAGYMGSKIIYNEIIMQKGLTKIDQGIDLYPNRLDMRFGKIYSLGQTKDWEFFTKEIIRTIQFSATNNNKWTWTNNKPRKGGEKKFLLDIQDYQLQLYNTGDDSLLLNMRQIATEILKIYPNHIESLTNLSISYLVLNEFDEAIENLLKALEINPRDIVVLSNLAHAYKLNDEKNKSINYYNEIIKYGDKQSIDFAKKQIDEMNK